MYLFLIFKGNRETKLPSKLILLRKQHKLRALKRIYIFSKISKSLFENLSMLSNSLLDLSQPSTILYRNSSSWFELLLICTYLLNLLWVYCSTLINLWGPMLRIALEGMWRCIWLEDIGGLFSIVEKISRRCWKHGVYNLFEVIIQLSKSFLSVCTYSILHDFIFTLIKSMRRFMRSRSG